MSPEDRMREFVERMSVSGVAQPGDLRGCSTTEIAMLERRYSVVLPPSYALFLSHMGHAAGGLGNLGEFDLSFRDALRLTGETMRAWQSSASEDVRGYASAFPRRGLVFCVRLGNPDYWLIVCDGQEDSPVFHFDYENEPVRFEQAQESLFGFLEELRGDAEHWIRRGML